MTSPIDPSANSILIEIERSKQAQKLVNELHEQMQAMMNNVTQTNESIEQQSKDIDQCEMDIKKISEQQRSILYHLEQAFWLCVEHVISFIEWIFKLIASIVSNVRDMGSRRFAVLHPA